MILRVWSDLPTFREVTFGPAMNIVLADRGADSEETESTNGLGKTTLLRIIHFCLGSDISRDKVLSHPDLTGVRFGIDLVVDDTRHSVSRATNTPGIVRVSTDFLSDVPVDREPIDDNYANVSIEDWRTTLSYRLVPESRLGSTLSFSPDFRDLSRYFIRVGKDAYIDPQSSYRNENGPTKRLTSAFLLGLNWNVQRDLHSLIKAKDSVQSALNVLHEANDATGENSIGELEAARVVLEKSLRDRENEVENFNLRKDYHELEERLGQTDLKIHALLNENHSDKKLLQYYRNSADDTPLFDSNRPVSILEDAGAIFRPEVLRSLNEVAEFHAKIYQNRYNFLKAEISRLQLRISLRDSEISRATDAKSHLLRVLASGGALESMIELQRSVTEHRSTLEGLKARIEERKRFDRRKDQLASEIGATRSLLKRDLDDRREVLDEAIGLFAEYTKFLYGVPGRLGVDVKDAGYRFAFTIDRQGSDGVDQMVVFCFDLMIATLRARRGAKFTTLIHDSSLFADVDPRQYGLALQLAATTAETEGFQYICCLNAGALPFAHLGELNIETFVRLRLTDDRETGRLLGKRLPPRER